MPSSQIRFFLTRQKVNKNKSYNYWIQSSRKRTNLKLQLWSNQIHSQNLAFSQPLQSAETLSLPLASLSKHQKKEDISKNQDKNGNIEKFLTKKKQTGKISFSANIPFLIIKNMTTLCVNLIPSSKSKISTHKNPSID